MRSLSALSFGARFGAEVKTVVAVAMLWIYAKNTAEAFRCPPGFINFGTSLSDTGSVAFSFPGDHLSGNLPYGETFFGSNAYRFSDGRLVIDFLGQLIRPSLSLLNASPLHCIALRCIIIVCTQAFPGAVNYI